jgi:hypothetical protein
MLCPKKHFRITILIIIPIAMVVDALTRMECNSRVIGMAKKPSVVTHPGPTIREVFPEIFMVGL